jgi:hypothetical protein
MAIALGMLLCCSAGAEDIRNMPSSDSVPADPASPPANSNPFNSVGRWLDQTMKTITKAPTLAGTVSGREKCETASNGAPDCIAAVTRLCRSKGFQTGTSVDTQSEYCLNQGRIAGSCVFVTRVACR